ncbi:MAG: hypothetical protein IAA97_07545 [Spirochaetes bacterium]|uniref:DUF3224 domain-containing protein n=1 Tax=Candidatus Ornithospirochaeta stercoripullorum TaxID=2840899 RepID=A0A9D9E1K4_9SPIO|nr:hypothetical protein [Candidatus Ornithospirochaeta stercoripullorum]
MINSHVRADITTFYGDFPAGFDFTISDDGKIEGVYSFIGYEGSFYGSMTGEETFSVGGVVDSYVGSIEFSISGSYDGKIITGEGITANKGHFTVRGVPVGEL